jgi:hypothetical protein
MLRARSNGSNRVDPLGLFKSQARRAFRRLEQGLGDYAVKA